MNLVFVLLFVAAVIAGAIRGDMRAVGQGAFDGAASAVTLSIGLVGVMALWLGLLRIAEKAGLVEKLARAPRPLFPGVPDGHPAISAMLLNIAANMLGLGNAATPFGIKAMEELEKLNPTPGTATNAQVLFLAINTASIQLVPTTVIALRASAHSSDAAVVLLPTLAATACALTVAIVLAKLLERVWK